MNKSIFSKVIILAIVLTLCAVVILTAQSGTFFGLKKNMNMDNSNWNAQNAQDMSSTGTITVDQPQIIYVQPDEEVPEKEDPTIIRKIIHVHRYQVGNYWFQRNLYTQIDNSTNTNTEIVVEVEDSPITIGDGNTTINDNLNDNQVDVNVEETVDNSINDSGNTDTDTNINIDNNEDNDVVDVDVSPETTTPESTPVETTEADVDPEPTPE